jgi:uncharacterized protein (DUF1800 family)
MAIATDRLNAALALSRFGLGARAGDIDAIASDPKAALKEEIATHLVPVPEGDGLKSSRELLVDYYAFTEKRREERERKASAVPGAPNAPQPATPAPSSPVEAASGTASQDMAGKAAPMPAEAQQAQAKEPPLPQQVFLAEAKARFSGTVHVPRIGFGERLAMFWANHFAISATKGGNVRILAGAFEREAIRPNVFGRFQDMLLAVETHPAMLFFLDNQQSLGPNSRAGQNRKRGLNENLAREILELHTLGVDGGYSQADVTSLARIITGWTVVGRLGLLGNPGTFTFFANAHEPGDQQLLGKTYADAGFEQGKEALIDLARHKATATHIARKLARHFVADQPPPLLVERLAATFRATDGDLAAVANALVDAKEAWTPQLVKLRSPLEFSVAVLRATNAKPAPQPVLGGLYVMGQPLWQPPGPNGFPDTADAWASPEGLKMRMDIANVAATKAADFFDPPDFLEARLGPLASNETRQAVARAESRAQGLAITFMSPEFQRR